MFPDIKPAFTHVEKLLVQFANIKHPTLADFMAFRTRAQVGDFLDKYRANTAKMTQEQLQSENHDSARMGRYMRRADTRALRPGVMLMLLFQGGIGTL
ncbi:hypothetical protein [Agarilytica rhodophyticola]|uniref:hypothetical protein n=1 Tax=Agarilytica rhodophyticola TaxID=1737490 RepID=UPI000B347602|nr:hypothetical protein [Agarilytica rhodophyticola]